MGQEPVLFSGSIADNIAYGLDPTLFEERKLMMESEDETVRSAAAETVREKVIAAAKLANAHDFISAFPQGYDTDVGSNGTSMSGGQKQRIAIARALVKRPAVLLLDEATSALDAASERLVQESIDQLQQSKQQTTIVIAHRLSTIRGADQIAVVKDGVIAEIDKHEELVEKCGIYAELIRLQLTGADEEKLSAGHDETCEDSEESKGQVGNMSGKSERNQLGSDTVDDAVAVDPAKAAAQEEVSKEEKQRLSRWMWSLVREQWHWFALALLGAAVFGGVFPSELPFLFL